MADPRGPEPSPNSSPVDHRTTDAGRGGAAISRRRLLGGAAALLVVSACTDADEGGERLAPSSSADRSSSTTSAVTGVGAGALSAADFAGRPTPSVVCSLPVWVTDDPGPAKEFVGAVLKDYATLPSYRAMLDIEGVNGVADISLIGPEEVIAAGIEQIAAAGATDFTAIVMGGNPDERSRTVAALAAAIVE